MPYAAMMVLNGQVQYQTVGQADSHPQTVQTMLSTSPQDGVAHLFEFQISDTTGLLVSATMDKSPISLE
jgi:hypothetical protein